MHITVHVYRSHCSKQTDQSIIAFIRENYFVQFCRPLCRLNQVWTRTFIIWALRVFDLISWFSLIPQALMQWHWAHLCVPMLHIKIFYRFGIHLNRLLGHVITLHQQLTTCKFCSWWEYISNKITTGFNRSRLSEYYLEKKLINQNELVNWHAIVQLKN